MKVQEETDDTNESQNLPNPTTCPSDIPVSWHPHTDSSTVSTGTTTTVTSNSMPSKTGGTNNAVMFTSAFQLRNPSSVVGGSSTDAPTMTRDANAAFDSRNLGRDHEWEGTSEKRANAMSATLPPAMQVTTDDVRGNSDLTKVAPAVTFDTEGVHHVRAASPGLENLPEISYGEVDEGVASSLLRDGQVDDDQSSSESRERDVEAVDSLEFSDRHVDVDANVNDQVPVAAELSPFDDMTALERLRRQFLEESSSQEIPNGRRPLVVEAVVVADPIVETSTSEDRINTRIEFCGWPPRSRVYMLLFVVILVAVGTVTGVVLSLQKKNDDPLDRPSTIPSSSPSAAPTQINISAVLVSELAPLIVRTEADLIPFNISESPQSRALKWLTEDAISIANVRSTNIILQRYVVAVLYYSTLVDNFDFLIATDVCTWNNGLSPADGNARGIMCEQPLTVSVIILNALDLNGTIPWELGLLSNLKVLSLSYNEITGTIPTELGQLTALEGFSITHNRLTGPIPSEIGQLTALEGFSITHNHITGPIPSEIGQLTALRRFSIDNCKLNGTVPTELGQLTALEDIAISVNEFTGSLPSEVGQLTSLRNWWSDSNMLTGKVPTELGQLMPLVLFAVSRNNFSGPIPTEFGQLSSLFGIWIDNNFLTGTVLTEFGQLTALKYLDVRENYLTGPLPSELGRLSLLQEIFIDGNHMSGTVPTELAQLSQMTHIGMKNTNLTGSVNETLCESGIVWSQLESDCLTDEFGNVEIECSCCTVCCNADGTTCEQMSMNP